MIIIVFLLMFFTSIIYGQEKSTGTVTPELIPLTTFQLIMNDINQLSTNVDKIEEIGKELLKNPDTITGQSLTNIKTYLEVEVKHKKQGRNYFGHIEYPVYIKRK